MDPLNLLRRKDTTKGPPLRILSLDGGGVRGYSMLIILQELMHRTYVEAYGKAPRKDQIPKPADYFDLIVGSGTGGLIAIMLGRLRLDLETCKEVYIKTAKKVFETDKRIAGIPYTKTIFKASKLEEAIQEVVMEHTLLKSQGNDESDTTGGNRLTTNQNSHALRSNRYHMRCSSVSSFSSKGSQFHSPSLSTSTGPGNPDALLYDRREDRTKTAVTAVYKGTPIHGPPTLLRSYDSRKEPPPEFDCTIWQAGRATAAMLLAFKEIQIGQSVFLDEGPASFNPAPVVLEEACVNEWPSREVGVFVSIGTGKRPPGCDKDAHLWYEGFLGDFADARRRMVAKIEACEDTHNYMIREGLAKHRVNPENYFRFNVEIGVGEYEMNEWNRLAEISTSTRRYLAKHGVQSMSLRVASKMAKINRAKLRYDLERSCMSVNKLSTCTITAPDIIPEAHPNAVELPADQSPNLRARKPSKFDLQEKRQIPAPLRVPQPSWPDKHYWNGNLQPRRKSDTGSNLYTTKDDFFSSGSDKITIMSDSEILQPVLLSIPRVDPPAIPPKLVIHERDQFDKDLPPYPLDEIPPPTVNMSRKPNYRLN